MVGQSSTVWILGLLLVASVASHANAVSCPQAVTMLIPCQDYLVNPSAKLTVPCCQAASKLNSLVHSRADIKDMCTCLTQAAAALHVIADRAKSLPDQCHIHVPVPLDPNTDCSRL
ncbi:non-specific lipid-transfer protein 1-like [Salvia hispanica]|uniref:non-specific lipid-transfer protein 1-like n=1 Tax=Salvia hispanica TaxID=49212 RepID=UPI002008FD9B|nr:non-specific lipid-transfer protein 1-like [Salvia hispanica]